MILTEAGSKRRASLYLVRGEQELAAHNPGGLEVLTSSVKDFGEALTRENHTLKRALTDPHLLSGVGNAYSDEILHAARLSPMLLTSKLTPEQIDSLHAHTIGILTKWRDDLIAESGDRFPEKVTAFREGMAAHGRYGKPCPVCGTPIQRIQYADNEANYCPTCQTGGKLLADRGLSRLLKGDWPKSLEELERRKADRLKPADSRQAVSLQPRQTPARRRACADGAAARSISRSNVRQSARYSCAASSVRARNASSGVSW